MANANQTASSLYYYALNSLMHFKPIFHNKSAYFLLELSRNAMHLLSVLIRVLPLLTPNLHHYFHFQQNTLRRSFVNIPEHVCVCVCILWPGALVIACKQKRILPSKRSKSYHRQYQAFNVRYKLLALHSILVFVCFVPYVSVFFSFHRWRCRHCQNRERIEWFCTHTHRKNYRKPFRSQLEFLLSFKLNAAHRSNCNICGWPFGILQVATCIQ